MHFDIKPLIVKAKPQRFETMKVAPTKALYQTKSAPLLPLTEDVSLYKLDKTNSTSWDLSTQPGTAGAPTYKFQVRILQGDETPRQMTRWRLDVTKVCVGLNVTTKATRCPIMEASMRAGPLTGFNAAIETIGREAKKKALETALATDAAAGNTRASDAVRCVENLPRNPSIG